MNKKEYFSYKESAYNSGYYVITYDYDAFYLRHTEGSFNVICARVLGLTYPSYLRMCRDLFGATIRGKGQIYPVAYFKKNEGLFKLVRLLNTCAEAIIFEKEHPDHKEHAELVEKYKKGELNE